MVDVDALFILCGLVAVSLLQFDFLTKTSRRFIRHTSGIYIKMFADSGCSGRAIKKTIILKDKNKHGLWS